MLHCPISKQSIGAGILLLVFAIGCAVPPLPHPITPTSAAPSPIPPSVTPIIVQTSTLIPAPPTLALPMPSPTLTPIILPTITPLSTSAANLFPPLNVAAPNSTSPPIAPSAYLIGTTSDTNVAQAQARLFGEGLRFYLIVVTPESTGVEQEIYQDLIRRNLRATSGPDEGIDTSLLPCFPNCEFTPYHAVNEISVESWVNVLRHEQRHMVQAAHNPNLARDFREANGLFTTYAAFEEACADDGIYVGEFMYHASERMPKLKMILGEGNALTLAQACEGDKTAYENIVNAYGSRAGGAGSFAELFPPYR